MRKKKIPASCYECDHVFIDSDTGEKCCKAADCEKIQLKRGQSRAEFCHYIQEARRHERKQEEDR